MVPSLGAWIPGAGKRARGSFAGKEPAPKRLKSVTQRKAAAPTKEQLSKASGQQRPSDTGLKAPQGEAKISATEPPKPAGLLFLVKCADNSNQTPSSPLYPCLMDSHFAEPACKCSAPPQRVFWRGFGEYKLSPQFVIWFSIS